MSWSQPDPAASSQEIKSSITKGTDILGQGTPDQSAVDNIDLNTALIGKPGNSE
jgi:hypothetical protein